MVWRSSTNFKDRFFSSLVYVVPLLSAAPFGSFLFQQFPQIKAVYFTLMSPFIRVYQSVPFAELIIFFILFLAIVRNDKIPHFIRFNTMQALLMDILLAVFGLILGIFPNLTGLNLILETLFNMAFLATILACLYSMLSSVLGKYAEIPTISEVAYNQVRW
jgi:uncharacterized membrane protein